MFVLIDGKIYAIGGLAPGIKTLSTFEVYSPAADGWKKLADMPQIRYTATASVVNGKIYVCGGYVPENQLLLNIVDEYNPSTGK
jgi:N-acetylneuraminic acid mutarotase